MIGSSERRGPRVLPQQATAAARTAHDLTRRRGEQCGPLRPPRLRLLWCVVLLGAVVVSVPAAAAQQPETGEQKPAAVEVEPEPTWYASSLSRNEGGAYLVVHFWSKGAKFRAETVIAGHRVTTIVNGKTYFVTDPVLSTGVAIRRSELAIAQDATRGRPFGRELEQILRDGAEKVRRERVKGRECDVYQVTDEQGRRQVCVTLRASRVPLRVENFDRRTGKTTYVDYTDWLAGPLISDSFFAPDERIDMERVGYEEYRARIARGQTTGPAPVLYGELLNGRRER
jgi:hypothetical protein